MRYPNSNEQIRTRKILQGMSSYEKDRARKTKISKSKPTIAYGWTSQAVACHILKSDCSKCSTYKVLGNKCRMKQIVPDLLERLGRPENINPNTGERYFRKEIQREFYRIIKAEPGITSYQLERLFEIPKYACHDTTEYLYKLGVIDKEVLRSGSIRFAGWYIVEDIEVTDEDFIE